MTRSWTDPRTGKRWRIDVVRAPHHPPDVPGRGGAEAPPAITFETDGTTYSVPTQEALRLEALEDDRLAELLDRARSGDGPQANLRDAEGGEETEEGVRVRGEGEASPTAAGRESQPHRDPVQE